MDSERILFDAWRTGDDRAGSKLFGLHFDELYRFFRRKVADTQTAEDLVQQTFLACVRNQHGLRGDASFRTYLFSAARSRLIDHYRRRGRRPPGTESVSNLLDTSPSPSSQFRGFERRVAVREAMKTLSEDHRAILEMHYLHGFRGAELARLMEIPEPTCRSRLQRARAKLARRLHRFAPPA